MSFFAYEFIKPGIFPANLILSFPGHGRGKKEVLHSLLPKVLHACCQKLCILICEKLCILIYRSHRTPYLIAMGDVQALQQVRLNECLQPTLGQVLTPVHRFPAHDPEQAADTLGANGISHGS